jgi:hypothetical protein
MTSMTSWGSQKNRGISNSLRLATSPGGAIFLK